MNFDHLRVSVMVGKYGLGDFIWVGVKTYVVSLFRLADKAILKPFRIAEDDSSGFCSDRAIRV